MCIVHYKKKLIYEVQNESRNVAQGMEDSMAVFSLVCAKGKQPGEKDKVKTLGYGIIEGLRSYKGKKNIEQTEKLKGFFFHQDSWLQVTI